MRFGERPLKAAQLHEIERTIGDALSSLVDSKYEAIIQSIDFEPCLNAELSDTVDIKLRLRRPSKGLLFGEGSEAEADRSPKA